MKKYLTTCLLCILSYFAFAEGSTLTGKVLDQNDQPVIYATVILKNATDSLIYKGEITNESGEFLFQNVKQGNYFIEINFTGFLKFTKSDINVSGTQAVTLGILKLNPNATQLNSVVVESERPFIERQADKMVVNVDNSIIQAGSSVMEVFEKLPGVTIDQDGNIRIRGKQGVIIVIDEKPTAMSGQDLINMLKGMSASNIQKVEIITNPSSKWDAAGNSGILNIVMKKNKLEGYNGSVNFTYGQGRYPKYNSTLSLSHKNKKVNLFFNYSYSNRKTFNNLMIDRKFYSNGILNETFLTDNYIIQPFQTHNPRIGFDYTISQKTTISILATSLQNSYQPTTKNHTDILNTNNIKANSLDFSQNSKFRSENYEFNAQINHKLDTVGQSVIINLDYGQYKNNSDQFFTTYRTDFINNSSDVVELTSDQNGNLYLYSFKADYSKPLPKSFVFEAGVKSSLVKSDKDMRFYNDINDVLLFDTSRSSHFLYNENINAAYISFQKKIKELTLQAGLRAEQTVADGLQKLNAQSFDRNYFQIFPTLYVNYDFGKQNINANIGRRINRPGYEQMNPFKRLIDFTTYAEGNPYLLPELTYVSELSYSYDNTYFITLNYSHTSDNITDVLIQDAATRTTIQSIVNLNEVNFYSIDLTYSKRLTKWWKTNTNLFGFYSKFTGTVNRYSINQGDPTFSFNTSNSFTISENWSAEAGLRFNYKNLYGVTIMRNELNITAGIKHAVFQKRGNIVLNVTDLFWKAYPRGFTEFGDVTENWVSKRDTRIVNIGFTYNFGKGKVAGIRRNTGADEEKQRI